MKRNMHLGSLSDIMMSYRKAVYREVNAGLNITSKLTRYLCG